MPYARTDLGDLDIDVLANRCAEETHRFFRKQTSQNQYCFELFYRAIVLGNQFAWEYIYTQYRDLVTSWVQKHPVFAECDEDVDYFINGVFARFERWCTPQRFERLDGLPQCLASLKACTHSEIIDYHRKHVSPAIQKEMIKKIGKTSPGAHSTVIDEETRRAFWQLVRERMRTEQERVFLEYRFILGYKPREISNLHPDLFAEVKEVYRVMENLRRRLRRDPAIQHVWDD